MAKSTQVSKWGSSLAVRIPKAIAEEWGIQAGTEVEMSRRDQGIYIRKSKRKLEDLVASLEHADLHPEIETDGPRGNEIW